MNFLSSSLWWGGFFTGTGITFIVFAILIYFIVSWCNNNINPFT